MADDIKGKRKDDGQSIPAILAAAPAKAPAPVVKAARPVAKPAAPVAKAPAVAKAAPVAPKPVVAAKPPIAVKPVVTAKPVAEPVPAPVAAAPAAPTPEPAPVAASAPAPAVVTPPAAVPADIQKEIKMATTIENVAQTGTDKAQALFAETSERAKGAIAKGTKYVEEMNAFGKGNVEALVESSKIAAKGFETLGQDAAEFARKSFEDASAAFKTLASVKSPTEFVKLQSDYVRSSFDALVAETSRSTESLLKLAGEIAQPISNRVSVAADKLKVAA